MPYETYALLRDIERRASYNLFLLCSPIVASIASCHCIMYSCASSLMTGNRRAQVMLQPKS